MLTLILVSFLSHSAIGLSIPKLGAKNAAVACEINPFGGADPTPLLVRATSFVYPPTAQQRTLTFTAHEKVDLACPGGQLILDGAKTDVEVSTASCDSGIRFTVKNRSYDWQQIKCSKNPVASARLTGKSCEPKGREAEIGFAITESRFVRTIQICFNQATQSPIYTYYDLIPAINRRVAGTPRPGFDQGSLFTLPKVNNLFNQSNQKKTINALLGLPEDSLKFIQTSNNYSLSRGHLTARSDFFYAAQQNSTFHFLNVLPQWQSFNALNWGKVETNVQDYAESKNVNLRVWTGGFGVTTLPHAKTGIETELHLYVRGKERRLPVPEIFWKVVYDPISKKGVALIGVNNPYKSAAQINRFCKDISAKLDWLSWEKDSQMKGISWACTVTDFRRIVKTFPEIEIKGLLT